MTFHVPEKYRVPAAQLPPSHRHYNLSGTNYGCFTIPMKRERRFGVNKVKQERYLLWTIASAGEPDVWEKSFPGTIPWEHVSVSVHKQPVLPTWEEMCVVKDIFWDEEDAVLQLHPPKAEYVNLNPWVLHLWKPVGVELPRPPLTAVGPADSVKGRIVMPEGNA